MPDGDLLVCYDGSEHAKSAIVQSASLLSSRSACVLSVWQPTSSLPTFAWAHAGAAILDYAELDEEAERTAARIADEGADIARSAGLEVRASTTRADGPIWKAIVDFAQEREAAVIVMGARGLTGLRHMFMGSVSEGVARQARRPVLIIH